MKSTRDATQRSRSLGLVLVAVLTFLMAPVAAAANGATGVHASCWSLSFPMTLAGVPGRQQISGTYCSPSGPAARHDTLQVLLPGFTYNRSYWDWPGHNGHYSYVQAMNNAGYPTLALDPLGAGASSHPPGALVTINAAAEAVHHVIQAARRGHLPNSVPHKVVAVGHSVGSATLAVEQATFHDTNGFINTGNTHLLGAGAAAAVIADSLRTPALTDPRLAEAVGHDITYDTTAPGTRSSLFYSASDSDPSVIREDEASKDTGSPIQLAEVPEFEAFSEAITVPTLTAVGENDYIQCAGHGGLALTDCRSAQSLSTAEAPFWALSRQFQAFVLPRAGHDLNLAVNAQQWFHRAIVWMNAQSRKDHG